jgi:hypothetical protein
VSTSPADSHRHRSQRELLEIAKQLPVPALPDGRREEMRTAFLATVREAKSTRRARALFTRGLGRLLLVAAMLLAGAGFAAAAWRITRGTPATGLVDPAAPVVGGEALGARARGAVAPPVAPEQRPVAAPTPAAAGPVPASQAPSRQVPRSTRRVAVRRRGGVRARVERASRQ